MSRTRTASTIEIRYDGNDIADHVLFAETTFESVSSATPGTAQIVIKDPNRTLSFVTGKEVELWLDGDREWGGIVTQVSRRNFFPAVDTSDLSKVRTRKWVLTVTDFNIWFDKRAVWDESDPFRRLHEPGGPLGAMVIYLFDNYVTSIPGLIVARKNAGGKVGAYDRRYPKGLFIGQGKPLRDQMEDLAQYGGAVWYINADKKLVFDTVEDSVWPYTFVDHAPNWVTSIGFREGEVNQDGLQMVTEALVWGGAEQLSDSTDNDGLFFSRYPDPPANRAVIEGADAVAATEDHPAYPAVPDYVITAAKEQEAIDRISTYGRWQRAEMRPGEQGYLYQDSVLGRAYTIVSGPTGTDPATGIDGGLNQPLWQVKLSWFAHDVPNKNHIKPGQLAPFTFYTMGGLSLMLPLRRVVISFPGLDPNGDTYVRFDGEFGIQYTDPRYLWRFLMRRRRKPKTIKATVTNGSSSSNRGDVGQFTPIESPDGSRTTFTTPFPYLSQTTKVYLNGLRQRLNYEYAEVAPDEGTIRFASAPASDDTIFIECRTGDS